MTFNHIYIYRGVCMYRCMHVCMYNEKIIIRESEAGGDGKLKPENE